MVPKKGQNIFLLVPSAEKPRFLCFDHSSSFVERHLHVDIWNQRVLNGLWISFYSFVVFTFARLSYNDKKILDIGFGNKSYFRKVSSYMRKSANEEGAYLSMTAPDTLCSFFFWGGGNFIFLYYIQHCFICRPSDSTVSEDAGIEPQEDWCNYGIGSRTL
jgi:hypothetical protein